MGKSIIVAGGTGLIGQELLNTLANIPNTHCINLVRKGAKPLEPTQAHASVHRVEFNFSAAEDFKKIGHEYACDIFYCCLGTTTKKAASEDAFRYVDYTLPVTFLNHLKTLQHKPHFAFVSSIGADKPRGLYLKTKWDVEQEIVTSGLPYLIVRPSLLLGKRGEFRLGERIAQIIMPPAFDLLFALTRRPPQSFARYAPIEAAQVAQALIHYTLDEPAAARVVEGRELFEA